MTGIYNQTVDRFMSWYKGSDKPTDTTRFVANQITSVNVGQSSTATSTAANINIPPPPPPKPPAEKPPAPPPPPSRKPSGASIDMDAVKQVGIAFQKRMQAKREAETTKQ